MVYDWELILWQKSEKKSVIEVVNRWKCIILQGILLIGRNKNMIKFTKYFLKNRICKVVCDATIISNDWLLKQYNIF